MITKCTNAKRRCSAVGCRNDGHKWAKVGDKTHLLLCIPAGGLSASV